MISVANIHWIAGFMDGEGTFVRTGHTIQASATQKDEWHIRQLQRMLGGAVGRYRNTQNGQFYWRWGVYGKRAAALMMTLYTLMSPRRQGRIAELLAWWRAVPPRGEHNRAKTHCKHGHEFSAENTYLKADGSGRECRACQRINRARYLSKKGA